MEAVVITEKSSQAKDVRVAVGDRYGKILPAQGHLVVLEPPELSWAEWDFTVLRPEGGFYRTIKDEKADKAVKTKLKAIGSALKTAETVVIATDCDREGEGIGRELLDYFGYEGTTKRAIFTATDKKSIREAFENLRPAADFDNIYQAFRARQQGDQIFNLTMTRAATKSIKPERMKGVLGVGRVKTPTLGLVCQREQEITAFTKEIYFTLAARVKVAGGVLEMTCSPKASDESRLHDKDMAEAIAAQLTGTSTTLSVTTAAKSKKPPRLFDLPELQRVCGSRFGWSAKHTLEVLQNLYDTHKILTYPRAETAYLSENQIEDVSVILKGLAKIGPLAGAVPVAEPVIRKGKSGVFCDTCLAGVSHHAIIPNAATADTFAGKQESLKDDEKRLFDMVGRRFAAAVSEDWRYDQTKITTNQIQGLEFGVIGTVTTNAGWKAAVNAEETGDPAPLCPVEDGETGVFEKIEAKQQETKPPARYTEGALVGAMQAVWKTVRDPDLQDRLKEAKGIGTPATRAEIIAGLLRQGQLAKKGKFLVPTEEGLEIYRVLTAGAGELLDAGRTAQWEMMLDEVSRGEKTASDAIDTICQDAETLLGKLKSEREKRPWLTARRGLSPKMVAFAKNVAEKQGLKLPPDFDKDFRICRAFLDAHASSEPSEKQVALMEKLIGEGKIKPKGDWRSDRTIVSKHLDAFFGKKKNKKRSRRGSKG